MGDDKPKKKQSKLLFSNYYDSVNYTESYKIKTPEPSYEIDDNLYNDAHDMVVDFLNSNIPIDKNKMGIVELNDIFTSMSNNFLEGKTMLDSVDLFNIFTSYMDITKDDSGLENLFNELSFVHKYKLIGDMVNNRNGGDNKELLQYYQACKNSGRKQY